MDSLLRYFITVHIINIIHDPLVDQNAFKFSSPRHLQIKQLAAWWILEDAYDQICEFLTQSFGKYGTWYITMQQEFELPS